MVSYEDTKTGRKYLNADDSFEDFLRRNNLIGRYKKIRNPKKEKKTEEPSE